MKNLPSYQLFNFAFAALLVWLCTAAQASERANPKTGHTNIPQSVFFDKHDSGKDPFFPSSVRRRETVVRAMPTNNVPPMSAILGKLFLKGISGTKGKPLALINNSTVAEGELADVRCDQRHVKVRCLEIRERSVLVELYGTSETRELRLREGI
jgi:hypothetical protein